MAWGAEFSVEPEAVIGHSLVVDVNLPDYDVAALGFGGSRLQLQGVFQRFLIWSFSCSIFITCEIQARDWVLPNAELLLVENKVRKLTCLYCPYPSWSRCSPPLHSWPACTWDAALVRDCWRTEYVSLGPCSQLLLMEEQLDLKNIYK